MKQSKIKKRNDKWYLSENNEKIKYNFVQWNKFWKWILLFYRIINIDVTASFTMINIILPKVFKFHACRKNAGISWYSIVISSLLKLFSPYEVCESGHYK